MINRGRKPRLIRYRGGDLTARQISGKYIIGVSYIYDACNGGPNGYMKGKVRGHDIRWVVPVVKKETNPVILKKERLIVLLEQCIKENREKIESFQAVIDFTKKDIEQIKLLRKN